MEGEGGVAAVVVVPGCTFDFLSVPSFVLIYKWQLGAARGRRRHGGLMGARVKVL